MNAKDEAAGVWLMFLGILVLALLVAAIAGCATSRQSIEVTAAYSDDRPEVQCSYKVNIP